MPLVGWRLIVWNGPVPNAARELIYKYISRNDASHCVSRHPTDGGEHTHIIYYETSNSDSLRRRILRRFPGTELRSRQVRCFYCHRTYLYQGPREMEKDHSGDDRPPGCKNCQNLDQGRRSTEGESGLQLCGEGEQSDPEGNESSDEDVYGKRRREMFHGEREFRSGKLHRRVEQAIKETAPLSVSQLDSYFGRKGELGIVAHKDYNRIASSLLAAYKSTFMSSSWYDILNQIPSNYFNSLNPLSVEESVAWFHRMMDHNNIDPEEFVNNCYSVMNRSSMKRNSILLLAPPNAGKTLLLSSLCRSVMYFAQCQNFNGKSNFPFQDMLNSRCALINEPMITDDTVETFKNVLEGQDVAIDVKFKTGQLLPRTPCFIASNQNLVFYTKSPSVNLPAIKARCFFYSLKAFPDLIDCKSNLNPFMWKSLLDEYVDN